jgi:hypothetical protein
MNIFFVCACVALQLHKSFFTRKQVHVMHCYMAFFCFVLVKFMALFFKRNSLFCLNSSHQGAYVTARSGNDSDEEDGDEVYSYYILFFLSFSFCYEKWRRRLTLNYTRTWT